eukprot:15469028-Alexandrium_andersonii.AAC.1
MAYGRRVHEYSSNCVTLPLALVGPCPLLSPGCTPSPYCRAADDHPLNTLPAGVCKAVRSARLRRQERAPSFCQSVAHGARHWGESR